MLAPFGRDDVTRLHLQSALAVKALDGAVAAADAVGAPHPALDVARVRVAACFLLGED